MKVLLIWMFMVSAISALFAVTASAQCTAGKPGEIIRAEKELNAAQWRYDQSKTPENQQALDKARAELDKLQCKAAGTSACTPGHPGEIIRAEKELNAAQWRYDQSNTPANLQALYKARAELDKLECKAASTSVCTPGHPGEIIRAEKELNAAQWRYDQSKTPENQQALDKARAELDKLECKAPAQ